MDMLKQEFVSKKIGDEELKNIIGGSSNFSLSGALFTALNDIFKTMFSFGQTFGSSLRRLFSNKICILK